MTRLTSASTKYCAAEFYLFFFSKLNINKPTAINVKKAAVVNNDKRLANLTCFVLQEFPLHFPSKSVYSFISLCLIFFGLNAKILVCHLDMTYNIDIRGGHTLIEVIKSLLETSNLL